MAEVFLAQEPRDRGERRAVVIKRMLPHIADEPGASLMFDEEARLAALVEHPNVVRVLDTGETEGQPFLVLEYVPGTDLARLASASAAAGEPLPLEVSLFIVRELLSGLHAVHEATDDDGQPLEIVHGDVSPSNILVGQDGSVKLSDFGIAQARLRRSFPQATAGKDKGKLAYLSPEQVRGAPKDRRSDIFSAAVVAAELVIGGHLFSQPTELGTLLAVRDAKIDRLESHPDVPEALMTILRAGLARDPEDRFATAAQFRKALDPLLPAGTAYMREAVGRLCARGEDAQPDEVHDTPTMDIITVEPALDDYYVEPRGGGAHLGPMRFADLIEGVTSGRISTADRVRRGQGPALPLREIGALADHVAERVTMAPPDAGHVLMGGAFVDALARRSAAGASGVFVCRDGDLQKEVYLIEGRPEFVGSNLPSELLGEFLVRRNILQRSELDMALAVLPRFDGRLGDTLTALGLIEPVMMFRYITEQVREKLLELFTWSAGSAHFEAGARPATRFFALRLDRWRVLTDGVQRRLELGLEESTFAGREDTRLVRTPTPAPDGLPEEVVHLLQLLDRPLRLALLLAHLTPPDGGDVSRARRAVRVALALDLVRFA